MRDAVLEVDELIFTVAVLQSVGIPGGGVADLDKGEAARIQVVVNCLDLGEGVLRGRRTASVFKNNEEEEEEKVRNLVFCIKKTRNEP